MDKQQAKEKLQQLFAAYKINRDAFKSEQEYVEHHLAYIQGLGQGVWDEDIALKTLQILQMAH